MSWASLDPIIRQIAQDALTEKQLVAYKLNANGCTEGQIALMLCITRRSVRDRLNDADIKILNHPDYPRKDAA